MLLILGQVFFSIFVASAANISYPSFSCPVSELCCPVVKLVLQSRCQEDAAVTIHRSKVRFLIISRTEATCLT